MDDSFETIPDDQILEPKARRLRQLRLPVTKLKTVEVEHPESGRAVINVEDLSDYEARGWSIPAEEAPVEDAPVEDAPAEEAPVKKTKRK